MRPNEIKSISEWICSAAYTCKQTQEILDLDWVESYRSLDVSSGARELMEQFQVSPARHRQVIQTFEVMLQARLQQSKTIGFRIEGGARLGKHFAGFAYEQSRSVTESKQTRFTVSVEPTPMPGARNAPTQSPKVT